MGDAQALCRGRTFPSGDLRSTSRRERDSRSSFQTASTSPLRSCLVALGDHLSNLGLLLVGQLRTAYADAPLFAGSIQPGLGPFFEHGPLELRECPNHLHHHSACWCRRVDGFGQTAEADSEDAWFDLLRTSAFARFRVHGRSRQRRSDGTMVNSVSGQINDVVKESITLCYELEAQPASIRTNATGTPSPDVIDSGPEIVLYYAGHGYYDKAVDKAYWWPVDAQDNDNTNWISAADITSNIKGTASRHVLIVSDSCYSGTD